MRQWTVGQIRRLALHKETVRDLTKRELSTVAGRGPGTDEESCCVFSVRIICCELTAVGCG